MCPLLAGLRPRLRPLPPTACCCRCPPVEESIAALQRSHHRDEHHAGWRFVEGANARGNSAVRVPLYCRGRQSRDGQLTNKKRSRQEDGLLNFAAGLPWWLGLLLAGLSAVLLHWLAAIPQIESVNGIPTPSHALRVLIGGVVGVGQLLLPIVFLAGAGLSAWARSRRQAGHQPAPGAREQVRGSGTLESGRHSPTSAGVYCPVCRSAMVRRRAKRGPQAGAAFWGCPGYPECRGTRPIA